MDADNGQDSELEIEQDDLNNPGSPNEGDDEKEDEDCEIVGCEDEQSEEDNKEVVSADDGGVASGKRTNKPPTGEELRTIKDATDLFRSNSFKLQVSVLCSQGHAHIGYESALRRSTHCCLTSVRSRREYLH